MEIYLLFKNRLTKTERSENYARTKIIFTLEKRRKKRNTSNY